MGGAGVGGLRWLAGVTRPQAKYSAESSKFASSDGDTSCGRQNHAAERRCGVVRVGGFHTRPLIVCLNDRAESVASGRPAVRLSWTCGGGMQRKSSDEPPNN
jgi:hypothetical protein